MIENQHSSLGLVKQYQLPDLNRSDWYQKSGVESNEDLRMPGEWVSRPEKCTLWNTQVTTRLQHQCFENNHKGIEGLKDSIGWQTRHHTRARIPAEKGTKYSLFTEKSLIDQPSPSHGYHRSWI